RTLPSSITTSIVYRFPSTSISPNLTSRAFISQCSRWLEFQGKRPLVGQLREIRFVEQIATALRCLRVFGRCAAVLPSRSRSVNEHCCGDIFDGHPERFEDGRFICARWNFAGKRFAEFSINFRARENDVAGFV